MTRHQHSATTRPVARPMARRIAARATGRAVGLILLAAACAGLGACSSDRDNTPPAGAPVERPYPGPRPDSVEGLAPLPAAPAPARGASVDQVAKQGLQVMFTWYCDRDTGPATATRRALAYLAPPMSTDVVTAPPVAAAGAKWDAWAAHRAVLSPVVTAGNDPAPPATPSRAYRQYQVTQTVRGADNWVGPDESTTVFVVLVRTPDGWRISDVNRT